MVSKVKSSMTNGVALLNSANSFNGFNTFSGMSKFLSGIEKLIVINVVPDPLQNIDILDGALKGFVVPATANWGLNIRGNSTTTLDAIMEAGTSLTFAIFVKMGATAYFNNLFKIDGVAVLPKWIGGNPPTAGDINCNNIYRYTIMKLGAGIYNVLASKSKDAAGVAVPVVPTAFNANIVVSANTANVNLKTAAMAVGWDGISDVDVTCTVQAGVVIGSTSASTPSFTTDTGWPNNTTLTLSIASGASIIGAGGAGGAGGAVPTETYTWSDSQSAWLLSNHVAGGPGSPGIVGGTALSISKAISINNLGTIASGGNGSAGTASSGLIADLSPYAFTKVNGESHTFTGSGGTNGAQGSGAGSSGIYNPGGGAQGGSTAITGNALITWVANGTKLGAISA